MIDLEGKLRGGLDFGRRSASVNVGFRGYGTIWVVGSFTSVLYDVERSSFDTAYIWC